MPRFSNASKTALDTCHQDIQTVLHAAIEFIDFKVLEGHRGQTAQDEYVRRGLSQIKWPNGKHNSKPSKAVDIAPWPIDWKDTERFVYYAGYIMRIADELGIKLRWGGDWDQDLWLMGDERFRDYGHFELVE